MSIFTQHRFQGPRPRHALGLWLNYRKLTSKGTVPSRRDRVQMIGKRPFDLVFGGAQDDVVLAANQTTELRQVVQSDFIAYASTVSASQSSQGSPGCRIQIQDMVPTVLGPTPGKRRAKKLSSAPVNNVNVAGSGQKQRYWRRPYRFFAGHTIIVKITNLRSTSNNIQVVISGVFDE